MPINKLQEEIETLLGSFMQPHQPNAVAKPVRKNTTVAYSNNETLNRKIEKKVKNYRHLLNSKLDELITRLNFVIEEQKQ